MQFAITEQKSVSSQVVGALALVHVYGLRYSHWLKNFGPKSTLFWMDTKAVIPV